MSIKKKIGHYWFYYKWYFLAVLFVAVILTDYVWGKVDSREADGQVAFVTADYISEETKDRVSSFLGETWKDANGDGAVQIAVCQYRYNGDTQSAVNVNEFMASAVQLSADLKERNSVLYFTDCPELLLDADKELRELGRWDEIPALTGLHVEEFENLFVLGWSTGN